MNKKTEDRLNNIESKLSDLESFYNKYCDDHRDHFLRHQVEKLELSERHQLTVEGYLSRFNDLLEVTLNGYVKRLEEENETMKRQIKVIHMNYGSQIEKLKKNKE